MSPYTSAPDYRTIHLSGSPKQLGLAQAATLQLIPAPFRRSPLELDPAFLRDCAAVVRSVSWELWEELGTFAAALGLLEEQGLFIRAGSLPHGCSSFAWCLPDGRVIAGRNYDFYERMPTRHLLVTQPQHGYAHTGMNGGLERFTKRVSYGRVNRWHIQLIYANACWQHSNEA